MRDKRLRILFRVLSSLLTACVACGLVAGTRRNVEAPLGPAPPSPPVRLHIVVDCPRTSWHALPDGTRTHALEGTSTYTFTNEWKFPVTLSFPPLCCYAYSQHDGQHGFPFPGDKSNLPVFAGKQQEIVIPPGKSVAFSSPFGMTFKEEPPENSVAFVFGMPRSPAKHPVVGTIYSQIEFREVPASSSQANKEETKR
jgi:hypothetical protein